MGFFDFFTRWFGSGTPALVLPSAAEVEGRQPRAQHYEFAHRALPSVAHGAPEQVMASLLGKSDVLLKELWLLAGEQAARRGDVADASWVPPPPLRRMIDRTAWFVITLPQPIACPEAYFVALGFSPGATPDSWNVLVRTLELSFGLGTPQASVIHCGWGPDGTHYNFGAMNVALTPEAFLDAILAKR